MATDLTERHDPQFGKRCTDGKSILVAVTNNYYNCENYPNYCFIFECKNHWQCTGFYVPCGEYP